MTRLYLFVSVLFSVIMLESCDSPKWHYDSGSVWGTTYHITYESNRDLSDSIIAVTSDINRSLSMFSPESTVSRINDGSTDSVDFHFKRVFNLARKIGSASSGAFDPTVAPLVDLWGFGRRGRVTTIPDSAAVDSVLERVGLENNSIAGNRILKGHPMTEFDFSGIAKGYGVECVAEMLKRNGCKNFMVEIGGEVQLAGLNPHGRLWHIQVDAPAVDLAPGDSAMMILELTDCAVATSGNYRNYRAIDADSVIGHTINPHTGFPAPRQIISATVITEGCAEADALATALMASSPAQAREIIRACPPAKAYIVLPDDKVITLNQ